MGRCYIGGQVNNGITNREDCEAVGGEWREDPPPDGGGGTCSTRSALDGTAPETIPAALAFRDHVLATTSRGKELVDRYYANQDELRRIVESDPDLVSLFAETWVAAQPFVTSLIRSASEGATASASGAADEPRLSGELHGRVRRVIAGFRRQTKDEGLRGTLGELERDLNDYLDVTPREAMDRFRRGGSKAG